MKPCFKCEVVKPISEFYKNSNMRDGHSNKCKECTKVDVRANRQERLEYYREYDRKRGSRQSAENLRNYRANNPKKWAAHKTVQRMIKQGDLVKPDECQSCGRSDRGVHGHHDDYSKPDQVRWLCPGCHHQWHAEHGEAANAA